MSTMSSSNLDSRLRDLSINSNSNTNQRRFVLQSESPLSAGGGASTAQQRMYINVSPAAVAARDGNIYTHGSSTPSSVYQTASRRMPPSRQQQQQQQQQSDQIPVIPKSQEVKKFIKEPSYSTMLLPQPTPAQASSASGGNELLLRLQQEQQRQQQQLNMQQKQQPLYVNFDFSEGDEVNYYPSPPSPVSSSYSELRQATRVPPGYYLQQMQQQQKSNSNYESLYEPIQQPQLNRKQLAAMASASNRSDIYYKCTGSSNYSDASDYFGQCSQCSQRIVGEGSGCEAMGRRYHVHCFTCHKCGCQLQGRAFYALDGKPYCSEDYLGTLEKCCKCLKPILERILRATGKPYHPDCFRCSVCQSRLDGVPFTVDSTNHIHCIPCFHQCFTPKCSVCKNPIMPEGGQEETVRVVALDRSFHLDCYRCEDCSILLSSDEESGCYPLDGHVLCKNCNTKRIQDLTSMY